MIRQLPPEAIERESFAIILAEMGSRSAQIPSENLPLFQRVIHTSADFDYLDNLWISPGAVEQGISALRQRCEIVTDTNMALSGISKPSLSALCLTARCRMADEDVAREAKERNTTRAVVSMERAVAETPGAIFVIGNAPTALIRLCELIDEGRAAPALVIGVPVGFVNVVESKELLRRTSVPQIVAMGRKGGSNVAAALVNALLYGLTR